SAPPATPVASRTRKSTVVRVCTTAPPSREEGYGRWHAVGAPGAVGQLPGAVRTIVMTTRTVTIGG
ncbi:hypothetical protein ACFU7Z_33405, partial [Kitasatospora sp. NPDC057518]|uniref:hypothetical protein n=1 Tax=Kitasatospora sp. NPDC057518 TaxID=3346155 RepID=UPI00367FD6F6